jgi:hypothetical protein
LSNSFRSLFIDVPQQVFGPITQPFYTVRLPRTERAVSGGTEQPVSTSSDVEVALHAGSYAPGNAVYCLPTHQSTAFVSPDMIRTLRLASKPTDASNMFDEELPEDEQVRDSQHLHILLFIAP